MSEKEPPAKKLKTEPVEDVVPGTSEGGEAKEGVEMVDLTVEKAKRMEDLAAKLWERDAKEAGLEGLSVQDAVVAAMTMPIMSLLPDPLAHSPGEKVDPDSWLAHGAAAGLLEDEDCMLMSVSIDFITALSFLFGCRKNVESHGFGYISSGRKVMDPDWLSCPRRSPKMKKKRGLTSLSHSQRDRSQGLHESL